mgnify:CR=1 FL=1
MTISPIIFILGLIAVFLLLTTLVMVYLQNKWTLYEAVERLEQFVGSPPEPQKADDINLKPMRLDVALSENTVVNQSFPLFVTISPQEIPVLFSEELIQSALSEFHVPWPQKRFAIDLSVHITAPECIIHGRDHYNFKMYRTANPPTFHFQLTPQREGISTIVVTVFLKEFWLGSAQVSINPSQNTETPHSFQFINQALSTQTLVRLRRNLALLFNLGELKTICFDLGIDYENFHPLKDEFTRELVIYCKKRGRINELIQLCKELRPLNEWSMSYQEVAPS